MEQDIYACALERLDYWQRLFADWKPQEIAMAKLLRALLVERQSITRAGEEEYNRKADLADAALREFAEGK